MSWDLNLILIVAQIPWGNGWFSRWCQLNYFFYFHPISLGKWSNLTSIFFRWVEITNSFFRWILIGNGHPTAAAFQGAKPATRLSSYHQRGCPTCAHLACRVEFFRGILGSKLHTHYPHAINFLCYIVWCNIIWQWLTPAGKFRTFFLEVVTEMWGVMWCNWQDETPSVEGKKVVWRKRTAMLLSTM